MRFFPLRRADPEGNRASWKRVGVCFGRLALTGGSDILSCSVIETEAAQRFPRFFFEKGSKNIYDMQQVFA